MWKKFKKLVTSIYQALRKLLLNLFLLPIFGGVATICGVFAGYLGSHYDDIVFKSFYPFFLSRQPISWEATSFYLMTWIFGISFTGTYWAQAVTNKQSNKEFQAALERLVTVPPRGFLENYRILSIVFFDFSTNFLAAVATASLSGTVVATTQIEDAIRTQLECILKVVTAYDSSSGGDTVYAANIMFYIAVINPAFAAQKAGLSARIKCIEHGVDIGNLSGVLDLQLTLSVRSDTGTLVDDKLTALALPVPQPLPGQRLSDHNALIPGAPFAFATKQAMMYGEQQELFDKIRDNNYLTANVKNELQTILQAQAGHVQTLICIPLFPSGAPSSEPVAILNIHKNKPDDRAVAKYGELLPLLGAMTRGLGNLVMEL